MSQPLRFPFPLPDPSRIPRPLLRAPAAVPQAPPPVDPHAMWPCFVCGGTSLCPHREPALVWWWRGERL
jgi:hypothetical protein